MMPYGWTPNIAAAHRPGRLLAPHRLGHHAIPGEIRQSGLWNVESVEGSCDPGFLPALEQLIQHHPRTRLMV